MSQDYAKRTPREKAYKAIDSERDYQDKKYPVSASSRSEGLLIISFAKKLDALTVASPGDPKQQEIIREIAALCVRAMEQHGAPLRADAP